MKNTCCDSPTIAVQTQLHYRAAHARHEMGHLCVDHTPVTPEVEPLLHVHVRLGMQWQIYKSKKRELARDERTQDA